MSKLGDFFLGFKRRYDEQVIRNKKMDEFLSGAHDNCVKIDGITHAVEDLTAQVGTLTTKVEGLQKDMNKMDERLEVIGRGKKIELIETLYRWKKLLTDRGWKTKEEMKEIQDLYELYNKKLAGNGQGTSYYNEIKDLPEKEIN